MGLWHLSLRALTKGDAEKVKSYAKELNNGEYNFHPFDESTLTGLEDIDMGIMYSHVAPDCLLNFHKFLEEITAYFSEVKLICEEFDSDTQQLFTYWSNNGILRLIKKCKIELYATDNFEIVCDFAVSAAVEAGLELNDCTEANAISFTYDALQKQEKVDLILDSLSIQFPNTEIVCLKETDDCAEMPYESCCVISNGTCKWHQLDYTTNDILMGMCYDCNINRFDAAKNPVAVVEKLLEKIRKGDTYPLDRSSAVREVVEVITQKSEYQSEFMKLLRPEEKEWITDYYESLRLWHSERTATPETVSEDAPSEPEDDKLLPSEWFE